MYPQQGEDSQGRRFEYGEQMHQYPRGPQLPKLPAYVWFFILAIVGIWGAWIWWTWVPIIQFIPMIVLSLTLGISFLVIALWKSPLWWCAKVWAFTAFTVVFTLVLSHYTPHFDVNDTVIVTAFLGGAVGFFALMWQALEN